MSDETTNIDPSVSLPTHHQTPEEVITWYAHLGMYVQAFESLVRAVRMTCVELTTPGNSEKPRGPQIILMHVVFSHQNMTLLSMFEILRALIPEIFKHEVVKLEEEDQKLILTILKDIQKEMRSVNTTRNNILHATWNIGVPHHGHDKDQRILMHKAQTSKEGLSFVYAVKGVDDFQRHIEVCQRLEGLVYLVLMCIKHPDKCKARGTFKLSEKKWSASRSNA